LKSYNLIYIYISILVSDSFSRSVILSKNVGDATLVLNNPSLIRNNYLFNRVLTSLIQFCTVSPYPPKTLSLNRIYKEVFDEYVNYNKQENSKKHKIRFELDESLSSAERSIKRIELAQHTLAGASVYALSRNDISRRLSNFEIKSKKKILPGPALLIQRESPSKKDLKLLNEVVHDFSDGEIYLWDNRIFIEVSKNIDSSEEAVKSLKFMIKPLSTGLVKEFERLTQKDISARKNLYSYLGMTPGSHLHTIPVLCHFDSDYIAIPTLNCYSDRKLFNFKFYNSSIGVYTSKFLCLP
jgi:hypothetical protein